MIQWKQQILKSNVEDAELKIDEQGMGSAFLSEICTFLEFIFKIQKYLCIILLETNAGTYSKRIYLPTCLLFGTYLDPKCISKASLRIMCRTQ